MKQYVVITKGNKTLYDGRISDIPIKDTAIITKSVELFDDDDPCIIHQSYVIKEYVDVLLGLFKKNQTKTISVKDYKEVLDFLDYTVLEEITINLKG